MLGDGEVFYNTEHASVHQALLDVYDRGEQVHLFSVISELGRTGLGIVMDSTNLKKLGYLTESGLMAQSITT